MVNLKGIFFIIIYFQLIIYGGEISQQVNLYKLEQEIVNFSQALDVVDILAKENDLSFNDYIVSYIGFTNFCLISNYDLFFEKYYKLKNFTTPRHNDVLKKENHFLIVRFDSFSKNKSSCLLKINILNPKTFRFFYLKSNVSNYKNLLKSVINQKHLTKPLRNILNTLINIKKNEEIINQFGNSSIRNAINFDELNSIGLMYNNSFYRINMSLVNVLLPFWYVEFYSGFNLTNYWKNKLCFGGVIKMMINLSGNRILDIYGEK